MKKQNVTMKVKEMLRVYVGLTEVIREKKLFSGEVNLAIARNSKILENEVNMYKESCDNLVEKYVHKDKNGNAETKKLPSGEREYVFETDEKKTDYAAAIRDLENIELQVGVHVISMSAFEGRGESPTAFDLVAMDFMIEG